MKRQRTNCLTVLEPLLHALQWDGTTRQYNSALAGSAANGVLSVDQLRNVMAQLGYNSSLFDLRLTPDHPVDVPVLIIGKDHNVTLVTQADELAHYTGRQTMLQFHMQHDADTDADTDADAAPATPVNGIMPLILRFRTTLGQVMLMSLLIGVLALAPTFYNMALYDHVIAASASTNLPSMLCGVGLALVLELTLRTLRNRRLGYFAARLDHVVNCTVFQRLLFLPPALTEKASVSAQLARLRDFEAVREFLTSPLASLFFEMPLVLIYIAAMAVIAGPVAWVPTGLVGVYAVMLMAMQNRFKNSARNSANAASKRQEFTLEMLTKLPAIRLAGLDAIWQRRYQTVSRTATLAGLRSTLQAQAFEIMSYSVMTVGVLLALSYGVHQVIAQNLTTGALIAAMMLIWRIVSPLQIICAAMTRLQQLSASTQQVQRLLNVRPEQDADQPTVPVNLKGRVTFSRVTLRYNQESEPALLGVSFDIKPGQVVAIRGVNGSGKSSILKLILGLYQPQGGAVRLDGIDLRQFDPLAVRQSIAYVPQALDFLPGSIRDNLLFAAPDATEAMCWQALQDACALTDVRQLPHGIDTIVTGEDAYAVPFLLQQRLNLARAYAKQALLILCDEASQSLGKDNDDAFRAMIERKRGTATLILVTHSEEHLRLADQILLVEKGELIAASAPSLTSTTSLSKDRVA